jgi:hypothetical protein
MPESTAVTFLGGPADGINLVVPGTPTEYRFASQNQLPNEIRMADPHAQVPISYVRYKRTPRVLPDGRRVYTLIAN